MKKALSPGGKIGLLIVIAVILVFGFGFLFAACGNDVDTMEAEQPVRPVKVLTLSGSTENDVRTFPGVVQAMREVDLAFRVGGPLVAMDVGMGQRVNKGDILARIDARDFEINRMRLSAALNEAQAGLKAMKAGARAEDIASLEAQLKAARSRLDDAKRNYERQKNLLEHNIIPRAQYDSAQAGYDTATANVDVMEQELKKARSGARLEDVQAAEAGITRLRANLKAAENAMEDTRLAAPFSGYVDKKHVENYENVGPGQAIVTLLDASGVEVRTAIPEDLVIRQEEIVDVTCTLDAYRGRTFPAKITEIGRNTSQANQSYPLTASLVLENGFAPQPGMAATLILRLNKAEKMDALFLVPTAAVFADPKGQSCVFRLDMKTMRVKKTPVETGRLYHDTIHITSGLSAGDRVVVAGARFLQEGQEVRILNPKKGNAS